MRLPREKEIPTEPRFQYVTQKAYDFLLECGYSRFPISPLKVLEDLSDTVTCMAWSDARKAFKTDDPFHLREIGAEARTIRPRKDGLYLIIYDDVTVNSEERITWTLMHEVGHIILGHLTDFGVTALDRGGLTKKDYGVLEVEAHYFAAEFLIPTALLKYFTDISAEEISLLFGVSEEAAKRKHKRVFEATYMPNSSHDEKLIRNFFDFLDSGIDEAIYRSIYGMWGLPSKSKYVPICRKCPQCYTYISDKEAIFCPHCGSEIEQKKPYKKMFERLSEQQKFAEIPGVSHPELPIAKVESADAVALERVQFCPNCLNHEFSDGALYCPICGHPLYNVCSVERQPLPLTKCYCTKCGAEATFRNTYLLAEQRLQTIKDCASQPQFSEEWIAYPYWGYTKMRMRGKSSRVTVDLNTAMLYSNAFLNDDDNLFIYTDTAQAAAIIYEHMETVLSFAERADDIKHRSLEVYILK